jgi:hypothetical protein
VNVRPVTPSSTISCSARVLETTTAHFIAIASNGFNGVTSSEVASALRGHTKMSI